MAPSAAKARAVMVRLCIWPLAVGCSLLALAGTALASAGDSDIRQKPGTAGCVSDDGLGGQCQDGVALREVQDVAVSPDGKSLYATAPGSNAIAVFDRNPTTGELTQKPGTAGCISETGTGGACQDGKELKGPGSVVVSSDGKSVYVSAIDNTLSGHDGGVAIFDRNPTTGELTQKAGTAGCISAEGASGACQTGRAIDLAGEIAIGPDGTSIYVATGHAISNNSAIGSVAILDRNTTTGELTQKAGTEGCASGDGEDGKGGSCQDLTGLLESASSVALSPDGSSAYVTGYRSDSIEVLDRNLVTGALTQKPGVTGCISETGDGGSCAVGRAIDGATAVTVSPDGATVYVGSARDLNQGGGSDAVAVFDRDPGSGELTQKPGTAGCISETGTSGSCQDGEGLEVVNDLAASPDGKSLYASGFQSDAVAILERNPVNGELTQRSGGEGCISSNNPFNDCGGGVLLAGAGGIALSPSGKSLYVASGANFTGGGVAIFDRGPLRTLAVTGVGGGDGIVTGPGIECPADCVETYADGEQVTLSASPIGESSFGGWSDACSGAAGCEVTMNGDQSVSAGFVDPPRTLTVALGGPGGGMVTGPGIACPGDCTETYDDGKHVTLSASPSGGSSLVGWSGACGGSGPCQLTLERNSSVAVSFTTAGEFGIGGRATTAVGDTDLEGSATGVAAQPDGRTVVVGAGANFRGNRSHFVVARFKPGGALDTSFSGSGRAAVSFEGYEEATGVAIQAGGKIVVVGSTSNLAGEDENFAIARYNADGSLDTSFDGDGKLTTDFGGSERANAVAIQEDGKIVVVGAKVSGVAGDFAIARYNADGSLDTSFDGDGKLMTDFGGSERANAVAIQQGGRLVVAGSSGSFGDTDFAVARYEANGDLDTSFDADGRAKASIDNADSGNAVAIQDDGKVVVAGYTTAGGGDYDFAVLRFDEHGALDPGFSGDGKLRTGFISGSPDRGSAVAIQEDGKIVVAGHGGANDLAVARYLADGSLDSSFDGDGKATTDFGGNEEAQGVAIRNGRIVAAGTKSDQAVTDFVIARYRGDGSLDGSFGAAGLATLTVFGPSYEHGAAVATQSDGKLVVAGSTNAGGRDRNFLVARYRPNGTLDTSFGDDGLVATDIASHSDDVANAVAIQANGKIVVAGRSNPDGLDDLAIARYNADGSLDTSFDGDGVAIADLLGSDEADGVAIQADGKIVVAGATFESATAQFLVARYNSSGTPDPSFAGDGFAVGGPGGSGEKAQAIAIQTDGKIVAAGTSSGDFAVERYNPNGTPDAGFGGGDGVVTTSFDTGGFSADEGRAMVLEASGQIVVAGKDQAQGNVGSDFAVARYNSDGSPDTSFDGDGRLITDFGSGKDLASGIAVEASGRISVVGETRSAGGFGDFALAVYAPSGALDSSFDGDGRLTVDFGATDDSANAIALQAGRIIAVGESNGDIALSRHQGGIGSPQRTLTVSVNGPGTVAGSGIACPGDCTESYEDGAQVTLTATPAGGAEFAGWSGSCGGSSICQITLTADTAVTAAFNTSLPGGSGGGNANPGGGGRKPSVTHGPRAKPLKCKKGYRKKTVHHKARCVKKTKKKAQLNRPSRIG